MDKNEFRVRDVTTKKIVFTKSSSQIKDTDMYFVFDFFQIGMHNL